jgi:hypothetical protein
MSEINHVARPHGPRTPMIARRLSTSCPIESPRDARAHQDTVAMDWLRLRTIVDALLCRTAASKDAATAIDATRNRAGAAMNTTPQTQEATHG